MLADPTPEQSPRVTSHEQAQAFIRGFIRERCYVHHMAHVCEQTVDFDVAGSSCRVAIRYPQRSRQGLIAARTGLAYDLARGVTEGMLKNMCLAAIEPPEAWADQDSKWKGQLNV
jgi:hypothetical protein